LLLYKWSPPPPPALHAPTGNRFPCRTALSQSVAATWASGHTWPTCQQPMAVCRGAVGKPFPIGRVRVRMRKQRPHCTSKPYMSPPKAKVMCQFNNLHTRKRIRGSLAGEGGDLCWSHPPLQGEPSHQPQNNKLPILVSILGFPLPFLFPFSIGFQLSTSEKLRSDRLCN
jgi:hypothetical protein